MECSDRLCIRFVYEGHKVYCGSDIALRIRDSRMDLIHTSNNSPLKRKTISAARPFTRSALIFEDPGGATLTNRASISFLYSILENGMDVFIRLYNYNTAYWKLQALFQKNISQDSKNPCPDSLCIAQKAAVSGMHRRTAALYYFRIFSRIGVRLSFNAPHLRIPDGRRACRSPRPVPALCRYRDCLREFPLR